MSATAQQTLSPPLIAENHSGMKERCEDNVIVDLVSGIPKQHESIHLRQKDLSKILKWLSCRFVMLWDTKTTRGWLVNGLNVLLYLLRTSLRHEERESVGSAFLFNCADLKEAESPHAIDVAKEFFGSESNLKQKISESFFSTRKCSHTEQQDEYEIVEDRVVELYYALEKALTYQQQAARKTRQARQSGSLKYLEG